MSKNNCIFCKIIEGSQSTQLLYEDNDIVIFEDIKPVAKHHYLVVTKNHIKDGKQLTLEHKDLVEKMIAQGKRILINKGGDVNDSRIGFHWPPFNSISHLHLHVISPASEIKFVHRMVFKPDSFWFYTGDYVLENVLPTKL